jgi:hypothetical protein
MTAKTSTHLANRALDKLLVVGLGQSPDDEDTAKALDKYEAFREFISSIDVFSIADDDDIDLAAFEWLATYFAYFLANDFGKPQEDGMRVAAEYNLRRITAGKPSGEVLRSEYF